MRVSGIIGINVDIAALLPPFESGPFFADQARDGGRADGAGHARETVGFDGVAAGEGVGVVVGVDV